MSAFIAALVSGAAAYNATQTVNTTYYTTYCPEPTTFTYQNSTYTVTEATTLTIEDCGCEETSSTRSQVIAPTASAQNTTAPGINNGAAAGKVGAVAGVAAVAALLL